MTVHTQTYRSGSLEQSLTPPKTPPSETNLKKVVHPRPEPDTTVEEELPSKRRKTNGVEITPAADITVFDVAHQEVLLLHAPKQRYAHIKQQPIPTLDHDHEMLVAVEAIGLNPIDWKAPYVNLL